MTPTIQDHRVTAPAWQTIPLTQRCDPPGSTSPPDKKTRAPLAQRCDPPGSTSPPDKKTRAPLAQRCDPPGSTSPPDKKTCAPARRARAFAVAQA
jgi:hypothetical protein